ncbi:hypothetical protein [Streptomyces sp. SYSU K217416]
MSRFGAGIRRGVMAADQFTQIANGLFRDRRLSFKAQGLFGLISTHRDGWRMTVTDLTRRGRDGEAAVKSGLKELEKYGCLLRERERNPDGTLGAAAYFITDLPSLQNSRSQPMSGFPPVDSPTSANRPTKNTNRKKTNKQKTSPLRPVRPQRRRTNVRRDGPAGRTSVPAGRAPGGRDASGDPAAARDRSKPSGTPADREGADRSGPRGHRDDGYRLE